MVQDQNISQISELLCEYFAIPKEKLKKSNGGLGGSSESYFKDQFLETFLIRVENPFREFSNVEKINSLPYLSPTNVLIKFFKADYFLCQENVSKAYPILKKIEFDQYSELFVDANITQIVMKHLMLICYQKFEVVHKMNFLLEKCQNLLFEYCENLENDKELKLSQNFVFKFLQIQFEVLFRLKRGKQAKELIEKFSKYTPHFSELNQTHFKIIVHYFDCLLNQNFMCKNLSDLINDCVHLDFALNVFGYFLLATIMLEEYKNSKSKLDLFDNINEIIKKIEQYCPRNSDLLCLKAQFHLVYSSDSAKAEIFLTDALECNIRHERAGFLLYEILRKENRMEECHALLNKCTNPDVHYSPKWANLISGLSWLKKERYSEAKQYIQNVLNVDSTDHNAWECLGVCHSGLSSLQAAIKTFKKALEINPDSFYSDYQIARCFQSQGKYEEAVVYFESLLSKNPSYVPGLIEISMAYSKILQTSLDAFQDRKAAIYFKKLIHTTSLALYHRQDMSSIWNCIGLAFIHGSTLDETLLPQSLPEIVKNMFENDEVCTNLTRSSFTDLATVFLSKAVQIHQNCAAYWTNLAYAFLKHSLFFDKKSEKFASLISKAQTAIKKALSFDTDSHKLWNIYGAIAHASGKTCLSQHCYIQSLTLQDSPEAWTNLGLMYLQTIDNWKISHNALSMAQYRFPEYSLCWVGLANIAHSIKHKDSLDLFRHSNYLKLSFNAVIMHGLKSLDVFKNPNSVTADYYHYCITLANVVPANVDWLLKSSERCPKNILCHLLLGLFLERLELYHFSVEKLEKCLELAVGEGLDENKLAIIRNNLARNYIWLGQFENTTKIISNIDKSAMTASTYSNLFLMFYQQQNWDNCLATLDEMTSKFPKSSSQIFKAYVPLYFRMDNFQSIKPILISLLKKDPSDKISLLRSVLISHEENDTQAFDTYLQYAQKTITNPNEFVKLHLLNKNLMKKFKTTLLEGSEKLLTKQNQNVLQFLAFYFIQKVVNNPDKKITQLINFCNLLDDFTLKCVVNYHIKQMQNKDAGAKNLMMQKLCFVYPKFLPFLGDAN